MRQTSSAETFCFAVLAIVRVCQETASLPQQVGVSALAARTDSAGQFTIRSGVHGIADMGGVVRVLVLADIGQPKVVRQRAVVVIAQEDRVNQKAQDCARGLYQHRMCGVDAVVLRRLQYEAIGFAPCGRQKIEFNAVTGSDLGPVVADQIVDAVSG